MPSGVLIMLIFCGLLLPTPPAAAQTTQAAVYGVVGAWRGAFASLRLAGAAAGLEAALAPMTSVGADVELLMGEGAVFSVSPGVRVRLIGDGARRATVPFAAAGYSYIVSPPSGAHAWHAGAGLDRQHHSRIRMRLELRCTVPPGTNGKFWAFRAGVVFR